jgi:large subunit ribosomal protein L17
MKNLAKDLIKHGHVTTTKAKARAIVPFVEKLITYVKKNENSDKFIFDRVSDTELVEKLKSLTKGQLSKVNSGFLSTYNVGYRKGDGSEMCIIMMSGYEPRVKSDLKKVKKSVKSTTKAKTKKAKAEEVVVENKMVKEKNK